MAKEWREVRLSDVADVDRESLGSATDPSLEFDYISLANVEAGRIVGPLKCLRYSQAPTRARRVLRCGDILVSTVRPSLLGFARVDAGHQRCIASTGFAAVSPGGDLDSEYLFQYMFSRHMRSQLQSLVVGSNYPAINSADLLKLRILLPPLPQQRMIAEILRTWDQAIESLQVLRENALLQKSGVMQILLSGVRSPIDELVLRPVPKPRNHDQT